MRFLKHPATVIASVALFVALGGGAAAYASGLINGSQIKNHSIAKIKLTQQAVAQLKGNRGPAGPAGPAGPTGPAGPQGVQGVQGVQGPKGNPGDPATADGPAVEMGNIEGATGSTCTVGAPSGVSTDQACGPGGAALVDSPLPADAVVTDLSVTVGTPVAADEFEAVSEGVGGSALLGCTITTGNTSCTAAGPSSTVPAGTPMIFIDWDPTQTITSFSYRLVTPGVVPAAAPKATPKVGFKQ